MRVEIPGCKEYLAPSDWRANPHSLFQVQEKIREEKYTPLAESEPMKYPCLAILIGIYPRGEDRCDFASYIFIYDYEVLK